MEQALFLQPQSPHGASTEIVQSVFPYLTFIRRYCGLYILKTRYTWTAAHVIIITIKLHRQVKLAVHTKQGY